MAVKLGHFTRNLFQRKPFELCEFTLWWSYWLNSLVSISRLFVWSVTLYLYKWINPNNTFGQFVHKSIHGDTVGLVQKKKFKPCTYGNSLAKSGGLLMSQNFKSWQRDGRECQMLFHDRTNILFQSIRTKSKILELLNVRLVHYWLQHGLHQ